MSKALGAILALTLGIGLLFLPENLLRENHRALLIFSFVLLSSFLILLVCDYRVLTRRQQQTIEQLMGLKLALTSLIDLKDKYTEGHSRRVRDLAYTFTRYLHLDQNQCDEIALGAELHDIGKIGVLDSILNKSGPLEDFEYDSIKSHPEKGANALKALPGLDRVRLMIRHHHERFDGTGYPDRLAGDKIPLGARIISLIDSYDSMLWGRVYRQAMTPVQVRKALQESSGKQFDPELTFKFLKFLNKKILLGTLDPVCGMQVNLRSTQYWVQNGDRKVAFCSSICKRAFQESPEKYRIDMNEVKIDVRKTAC